MPGDLHSRKISSYPPLLNVVSHTTTHFLFSLSQIPVSLKVECIQLRTTVSQMKYGPTL
jgi:hypothetical protein